jgi:hypothetical protein
MMAVRSVRNSERLTCLRGHVCFLCKVSLQKRNSTRDIQLRAILVG